ncbi:hypothetical protein C8J57DRAFT_1248053 [Mycena rebaudengoi]|nr:hypothetical protein C8J57DRAFT_1248053 [Mycena rebaudengoi]
MSLSTVEETQNRTASTVGGRNMHAQSLRGQDSEGTVFAKLSKRAALLSTPCGITHTGHPTTLSCKRWRHDPSYRPHHLPTVASVTDTCIFGSSAHHAAQNTLRLSRPGRIDAATPFLHFRSNLGLAVFSRSRMSYTHTHANCGLVRTRPATDRLHPMRALSVGFSHRMSDPAAARIAHNGGGGSRKYGGVGRCRSAWGGRRQGKYAAHADQEVRARSVVEGGCVALAGRVQVWIGVQALALLCAPCGALEKLAADVVESGFVGFFPVFSSLI